VLWQRHLLLHAAVMQEKKQYGSHAKIFTSFSVMAITAKLGV
jgi:hypothetical protein